MPVFCSIAARTPLPEEWDRARPTAGSATSFGRSGRRGPDRFVKIPIHEYTHLNSFIRIVPPNGAVEILGVKLVGVTAENGKKLLFSLAFIVLTLLLARGLRWLTGLVLRGRRDQRVAFWTRQAIHLVTAVLLLTGLVSVWFDDPTRLTTALGLVTAGLAFALQKVVTSVAGYFVILRGRTFNVGDRITMGASGATSSLSGSSRRPSWRWASRPPYRMPTRRCGCTAGNTPAGS